ncbi:trypsin-like peptidase domain-containing protein [Streptomyces sp. WMMC500]|nr:trypsin-like peptidase domain-containing protein [Streptomyces sp. WMMC500]WBB61303.1 trypsin-like peptidase domain-containing protein [Streptomyces sp. WMMC500]
MSGEWRVRLCIPGRDVVCGAGVLLPRGLILTCAHVVDSALGRSEADPSVPDRPVDVDFSAVGDLKSRPARVVSGGWFPAAPRSGDIAVLALESGEPPAAARPAALAAGEGAEPRVVRVYGYPNPGLADGVWRDVRVSGAGGPNHAWRQLDGAGGGGVPVQQGFSGAGVWDPRPDSVVGLLVAVYGPGREQLAWMFPLGAVAREWRPLAGMLGEPVEGRSNGTNELSPRQCTQLAHFILAIPLFASLSGRQDLVSLLRPEIRLLIAERSEPMPHMYQIVRTSTDYDGGVDELVQAIEDLVGSSAAARSVAEAVRRFKGEAQA